MRKVFKIYAERNNVQESDLQFFINGSPISGTSTAQEAVQTIQLEDDAIIEIECSYLGEICNPHINMSESDALIISVRNKGLGELMFKVNKSTNMSRVFKEYAERHNVRESELQFFINGSRNVFRWCNSRKLICGTETVQSLHLEGGAIIKCSYNYNPNLRTIHVKSNTGEESTFWVKESTEMIEIFGKYVEVLAADPNNKTVEFSTLRFFFNDKLISGNDTCQSLQLKDDDRIDCYTRSEILSLELLRQCESDISFSALLEQIIDSEPSSVRYIDELGRTLLAKACSMSGVESLFEVVQLLLNAWPEALMIVDHRGCLPIHYLCCNSGLGDSTSIDLLHLLISDDATLMRIADDNSFLPFHHAVFRKSAKFCKELLALCPETVRVESIIGLPIHIATGFGQVNERLEDASTIALRHVSVIELLLEYDPSGASVPDAVKQWLPLHAACIAYYEYLPVVRCLFDQYPEAIWARDVYGNTPLDLVRLRENKIDPSYTAVIDFLEDQLKYVTEDMVHDGNESTTKSAKFWSNLYKCTQDGSGSLPLHHSLRNNATLGVIKVLLYENPDTLWVTNHQGLLPIHIACQYSSVKVVNYLLDKQITVLSARNSDQKLPIHLLCESGGEDESIAYVETIWRMLLANPEL